LNELGFAINRFDTRCSLITPDSRFAHRVAITDPSVAAIGPSIYDYVAKPLWTYLDTLSWTKEDIK